MPNGGKEVKSQGIDALEEQDRHLGHQLLNDVSSYGIFLVPVGELESWLKPIQAHGHGPDWIVDLFSKIGRSSRDPNYLRPGNNDIWHLIKLPHGQMTQIDRA
jgi:hypothetical protein